MRELVDKICRQEREMAKLKGKRKWGILNPLSTSWKRYKGNGGDINGRGDRSSKGGWVGLEMMEGE